MNGDFMGRSKCSTKCDTTQTGGGNRTWASAWICLCLAAVLLPATAPSLAGVTEIVSVSTGGEQGNWDSYYSCASADGRYVAFVSGASNLAPGDTNGRYDVFVRDRLLGTTERVSISTAGEQGHESCWSTPSISADGRYVGFDSAASNLVPNDTNGTSDVFVRDRLLGTTERVSVSSSGEQANDGGWGPMGSGGCSLSADGRYVAFGSAASNLVASDTNMIRDSFVRDRMLGTTERVSVSSAGEQGNSGSGYYYPSISGGGRYVVFDSVASNLVPGDTNGKGDIFVRDRVAGTTERVSCSTSGAQADNDSYYGASISADGRCVAFLSRASNLVTGDTNGYMDVFVRDRLLGKTERVSVSTGGEQGNQVCEESPAISADGVYVAFKSFASNLVPGDTNGALDVFVRDRPSQTTELVSVSTGGGQADQSCQYPFISGDGRYVTFASCSPVLVSGDTNGCWDIFVRDRWGTGTPPVVTEVSAHQRTDGSHIVDIYYSLSSPSRPTVSIYLAVSSDGGVSYGITPTSTTGDIGLGVRPGPRRHIVWDAGKDLPEAVGTTYRIKVTAWK